MLLWKHASIGLKGGRISAEVKQDAFEYLSFTANRKVRKNFNTYQRNGKNVKNL